LPANDKQEEKRMGTTRNYVQIKVNAKPEIAAAFKEACRESEISMAEVMTGFMVQYASSTAKKRMATIETQSRGQRRNSVKTLIGYLEKIRNAEEIYMENIPENLKSSPNSEAADESIAALDEAIESLESAY
jgi:hypothetical protein